MKVGNLKVITILVIILVAMLSAQDGKIPGTKTVKSDKVGKLKAELSKLQSDAKIIETQYSLLAIAQNLNQKNQQSKLQELMSAGKDQCGKDETYNPQFENADSDGICMPPASPKKEEPKK